MCWYTDIIRQQNYRTSNQSSATSGGSPELFSQREKTLPKAASKLAAAPSTPPPKISKTPVPEHNSTIATTLTIESTEATVTVHDCGGPKKKEAEATVVDNWLQNRSLSFFGMSQSGCAMFFFKLRMNLDVKIASGLRKISTGNFKKQVTTAERKGQSEKRSLTGRQIAKMICDFLDFRGLSKVQVNNDNFQAFDTKLNEVLSASTDNILESLYKMQIEKSEELKYVFESLRSRGDIFGNNKYDYCRVKLVAQKHLEQRIKDSQCQSEKPRRGQTCNWSSEQEESNKKQGKSACQKTNPREETASARSQKANMCV